jgi:pimeloyl-ACP methyl ester carboxylesterase
MVDILSSEWWERLGQYLQTDERWLETARYVEGRIAFRFGAEAACLNIRRGIAAIEVGEPFAGYEVELAAPKEEWIRLVKGETDWFQAQQPEIGQLVMRGDLVFAMRNALLVWRTIEAMGAISDLPPSHPEYSPSPRPSGKPTRGYYVEVKGIRTYVEEAGEGIPILCLHAACQDSLMYRHVVDELSDSYRVIAVDAPGHCKTLMPPDGPYRSLTQHTEFNEELIQVLELERPVIVGCSMGGNMVLEMGARRPDFYRAIISAQGAAYTPTIDPFTLDMLLLNGQNLAECFSLSLSGRRTPPDRLAEVVWQIRRTVPELMRADLQGYIVFDQRKQVPGIRSPVLLIRGEEDFLVNRQRVEDTAALIPGSRISVLEGTGHYSMIENPHEFCQSVRSFLHDCDVTPR